MNKSPSRTHARATKTKGTPRSPRKNAHDAIALLTEDHKKVRAMFGDIEKLKESGGGDAEESALVEKICAELTVHAQVEEEIFYPAVREAIGDDDLMDEADVKHAEIKELISQLVWVRPRTDRPRAPSHSRCPVKPELCFFN